MRTIIIPKKFGFPTVDIIFNGKTHTLKSGEEITIEDHLAEIIENAMALAPMVGVPRNKLAQLVEGSYLKITSSDLSGITSIANHAFYKIKGLLSVDIPNKVTHIGDCAFYGCNNLETVSFGEYSEIERIGLIAFELCEKLSKVYLPHNPPVLDNGSAFNNINIACTFYCKTQESLDAYKAAPNWSTLTSTYSFVVENKNG